MSIKAVSKFGAVISVGLSVLLIAGQSIAEERTDVLSRIAPIGKVAVEGAVAPTPAPAASAEATTPVEAAAPATEAVVAAAAPAEVAAPAAEAAPAAAAGGDQLALATTSGCMACHQVEVKVVGPSYKEVAAKYKGDAAALDMLVEKVITGGSGTWGQIPMPPNGHVPEESIRAIVSWLLTF